MLRSDAAIRAHVFVRKERGRGATPLNTCLSFPCPVLKLLCYVDIRRASQPPRSCHCSGDGPPTSQDLLALRMMRAGLKLWMSIKVITVLVAAHLLFLGSSQLKGRWVSAQPDPRRRSARCPGRLLFRSSLLLSVTHVSFTRDSIWNQLYQDQVTRLVFACI